MTKSDLKWLKMTLNDYSWSKKAKYYGRTDRSTNRAGHRVACTRLRTKTQPVTTQDLAKKVQTMFIMSQKVPILSLLPPTNHPIRLKPLALWASLKVRIPNLCQVTTQQPTQKGGGGNKSRFTLYTPASYTIFVWTLSTCGVSKSSSK